MRLRDLETALARVPLHPAPKAPLEQYRTPPDVAARLIMEAHALGDIEGRRVADLGCGTGMLAVAAALAGSARSVGVDVDGAALAAARAAASDLGVLVEFVLGDVTVFHGEADTVVMNPPFGAQRRGADRPFLEKALAVAPVVYTLHNIVTRDFVEAFARDQGAEVTHRWRARLELPATMAHHTKASRDVDAVVLRMVRQPHGDRQSSGGR